MAMQCGVLQNMKLSVMLQKQCDIAMQHALEHRGSDVHNSLEARLWGL